MKKMLKGLWRQQSGDDVVEYALLVAMIALGVLIAVYSLGTSNGQRINHAAASLSTASSSGGGQSGGGSSGSGSSGGGRGQSGGGSSGGGRGESGGGSSGGGAGGGGGQGGGTGGTIPTNPVPIK
jgi:Flp pilus assembly pilin Flp